jgi:6-pyruvoyl-tetrahydropterin synthase
MTTQRNPWYFPRRESTINEDFTFEAAQDFAQRAGGPQMPGVHGHSFKVEVSVEGDVDPKIGWVLRSRQN